MPRGQELLRVAAFYSPVVYTPQAGKEITKLYLQAAAVALPGSSDGSFGSPALTGSDSSRRFRYTKQVLAGDEPVQNIVFDL